MRRVLAWEGRLRRPASCDRVLPLRLSEASHSALAQNSASAELIFGPGHCPSPSALPIGIRAPRNACPKDAHKRGTCRGPASTNRPLRAVGRQEKWLTRLMSVRIAAVARVCICRSRDLGPTPSAIRTNILLENTMRKSHLAGAFIGLAMALSPTYASAAPKCNEAPYGTCMRCYGWANLGVWAGQACYHSSNPQVRLACSFKNCGAGVIKPISRTEQKSRSDKGSISRQDNSRADVRPATRRDFAAPGARTPANVR
jgi:hypothetical protein